MTDFTQDAIEDYIARFKSGPNHPVKMRYTVSRKPSHRRKRDSHIRIGFQGRSCFRSVNAASKMSRIAAKTQQLSPTPEAHAPNRTT